MDKTLTEMSHRLSQLNKLFESANMTLRTSAERDAILNYGLVEWNQFLDKQERRRRKNKTQRTSSRRR